MNAPVGPGLGYWRERLTGDLDPLALIPSSVERSVATGERCEVFRTLDRALAQAVRAASGGDALGLLVFGLAAFCGALSRYCDRSDLVVATLPIGATVEPGGILLVRVEIGRDESFREIYARVRRELAASAAQAPIPSDVLQVSDEAKLRFAALDLAFVSALPDAKRSGPVPFRTIASMNEAHGLLELRLNAAATRDAAPYLESLLRFWDRFVAGCLSHPDAPIASIDKLDETARRALLASSRGPSGAAAGGDIGRAFSARAAAEGARVALRRGDDALCYRELDARSNRLANHLCSLGLPRESRVALLMTKSVAAVVAMLAVLKAGLAYVPLSVSAPRGRIREILDDCDAPAVIVDTGVLEAGGFDALATRAAGERAIVLTEDFEYLSSQHPGSAPALAIAPESLAYVLYTSGSTGRPKGVLVEHRHVSNLAAWYGSTYAAGRRAQVLQLTAFTFDPSVEQIFGALLNGGCVHLAELAALAEPLAAREWIERHGVNVINATPAALEIVLAGAKLPTVDVVISGGDALGEALRDELIGKGYRLYNHYGPTETTVDALSWECRPRVAVQLGKPIANVAVYVCDGRLELCPAGVTGEIAIGGAQVARGYVGDASLTAASFVPDPFGDGARVYRTGDYARRLDDGGIELVGRKDRQVKVLGARVNVGEVESALHRIDGVRAAAVASAPGERGGSVLTAYIVASRAMSAREIKLEAAAWLPEFMIPARVVFVDALPVDANGKFDVNALSRGESEARLVAPRDDLEREVAQVWSEVLGVDAIGVLTDFLQLGGHSLHATRVVYKLYEGFGVNVTLAEFFIASTVAGCAELVAEKLVQEAPPDELALAVDAVSAAAR